jgi:hypothetical protein
MNLWASRISVIVVSPEFWAYMLAGAVALVTILSFLPSCCAPVTQCSYSARFDGRESAPEKGVYPYYLVAECPGEATATIVESATRLHTPER